MSEIKFKQKKQISIRAIVLWGCMVYSVLMFVLLLLLQTVYLQDVYKLVRRYSLYRTEKKASSEISAGTEKSDLFGELDHLGEDSDIVIRIIGLDGEYFYHSDEMPQPVTADALDKLRNTASPEGGGYVETTLFKGKIPVDHEAGRLKDSYRKDMEALKLIRVKMVNIDGTPYFLYTAAIITPVRASLETIRIELIAVSVVMILFALFFGFSMAAYFTKPLKGINESAAQMAEGNYKVRFQKGKTREIGELVDTLQYAAGRLDRADQLQKELLANVSHDLRTPLTTITAYAELMRDLPGEKSDENIQVIIDEAKSLTSLVNDYLDISKLQAGIDTLTYSHFSLKECIENVIARVKRLSDAQGFTFRLCLERDVTIYADEYKISQVIYNLINNAVNYSGDSRKILITEILKEKSVIVEIKDFGPGIAEEDIDKIWERYMQAGNVHKRRRDGSGLGLSIVRKLLEMHSARYGVKSKPGKGSTFWFELPI